MNRLTRLWGWMVRATSAEESALPLAVTRICVGLSALWLLVPFVVTEAGRSALHFAFCDVDAGGYRPLTATGLVALLGGAVPAVVDGLVVVAVVAAACVVVGVFGRLAPLVALVCVKAVFSQNLDVSGAGDSLLQNALLLLVLGDATATLSLDCRWRTGRAVAVDDQVAAWPRKLGVLVLCVMYTSTGLQKLVSSSWTFDGFTALYQILQSPHWARVPGLVESAPALLVGPLALLTAVTIAWEISFFVVLARPRWRIGYAVVGVVVHAGIFVLMQVGVFSLLSVSLYPLLASPVVQTQLRGWWQRRSVLRDAP